ncbi:MAG TPA: helix-turn-helix domain-containing protein [Thermomicrobiales bacterium]
MSAEEGPKMITVKEARERLNISRVTMARLVKEGRFTIYDNPLDKREKLIPENELAEVKRPQPRVLPKLERESKRAA